MSIEYFPSREPSRETQNPLNPTAVSPPCSGLHDLPSPPCEVWGRSRSRSPFPFPFPFYFSFLPSFGSQIGRIRVAAITPTISYFPFHLPTIRFGLVRGRFAGGFGWLESPSASLSFVGTNLPFQWAPRPSTAVDVRWASVLGTSPSPSFYRP
jgi:hypothetical protein